MSLSTKVSPELEPPPFVKPMLMCSQNQSIASQGSLTGSLSLPRKKGEGGPTKSFLEMHGLTANAAPVEFADAFFPMYENKVKDSHGEPMMSMEYFAKHLNMRAAMAFAGEATYEEWSGNFSVKGVRQHIGLLVLNGFSPSPGIERKFDRHDTANFNPFVAANFRSNPKRPWRQFKAFFGCQDPMKPTPDRKAS